jgi:predicted nucleotidyltransferase
VRDKFLSLLPEDATFEDMNDVISELDPEYKNFIKALARNEWLGFDYPSQAINAALSEEIQDFEVTKSLKQAIGRMVNKALGVTAATKEKPLFAKKAKIGNEKYKIDLPTKDEITQVILDHPLVKFTGKVKNAYIIGSFAKGSPNEMSDVDVLFEVNKRKGYTEQQLIEKYRRGLQQYFVENKIMERRDDLHPQWNGRRVDIYFTYDASKETRPKVKLPESHAETFDVNDPDVLFSRAADDAGNAPVGQSLGMPEEGKKDLFVRLAQDSFNRIKTMQETILKKGGIIRTESDVYLAEERSSSKISYELKAFENKYQKPLIDLMGDKNLEPEEVDLYVIAKHAQERNEYVASINDDMQDGGSGMTTQQAKDILAEFENKRTDLEAAAQIIYDANNQTLDTLVKEGHMKEEAANELRERWDYYVPLKGKDGEDYKLGTGVGYNIAGSQFKHAMGRGEGNLPESPTAHSFAQNR